MAQLDYEVEAQRRFAGWLGGIALEQAVHVESLGIAEHRKNLADLIEQAALGDQQALAAVRMNASTTVYEMALKAGHISKIEAEADEYGSLTQHGHSYDAIFRNTLEHAPDKQSVFYARHKIEALNWHRMEAAIQNGDLEDHWMVEISLPPEDLTARELGKNGIFTDTMTGIFRCTTTEGKRVFTENAFVAGMTKAESNPDDTKDQKNQRIDQAMKHRFDITAVRQMLTELGVADADTMSPEDMLANPVCIPKTRLPYGVASLVEMYDQYVGDVFFGQNQPVQDYEQFASVCQQKARQFEPVIEQVVADLLTGAATLKGKPAQAIVAMDKKVEYHLQEAAYRDKSIDESIFGQQAIRHIRTTREAYDNNDVVAFELGRSQVQATSETTRCGGGTSKSEESSSESSTSNTGEAGAGGGAGAAGMGSDKGGETKLKWRSGYCRIDKSACPEKGQLTLVAQCEVCIKCQSRYFDKGFDPTKFSKSTSLMTAIAAMAGKKSLTSISES